MNFIKWIEYPERGHYLAIGRTSPWDRKLQVRVPKWLAQLSHRSHNDE